MRGPGIERQHVAALGALLRGDAPKFLGDERHERMQQLQDFIERPGRGGAGLGFGRAVGPGQHRLDQFQIPVAIDVPDETVERVRRVVELVGLDRRRDLPPGFARFRARSSG